jgi:predicted membrane channel-forming protein YqfA (hemolysin III family)
MTNQDLYKIAEKRAKAKLGFYIHATVYVLVTVSQIGINSFTTPDEMWSIFPALGWGVGVTAHYLGVFVLADWRIREFLIEDEMVRLKHMQEDARER